MRAAGRLISFGRVSHQTDVPTTRTASRTTKRRLFLRLPGEGWTSLSDRTPSIKHGTFDLPKAELRGTDTACQSLSNAQ